VSYRALDKAGNVEGAKIAEYNVDGTSPVSAFAVSGPLYVNGGMRYITPATELTFTAADPVVDEVASSVSRIEVSIDGAAYSAYSTALKFAEDRHTVRYRAIDNVGNVEGERTLELQSDNTAPASRWLVANGESIELDGRFYLNALGIIALESADPVASGVASGVEGIYYGIDAAASSGIRRVRVGRRRQDGELRRQGQCFQLRIAKSTVIMLTAASRSARCLSPGSIPWRQDVYQRPLGNRDIRGGPGG